MDDLNLVLVEGVVVGNVVVSTAPDGKKAINFEVESKRTHVEKGDMYYRHQVVLWDKLVDKVGDKIVNGLFVRVRGHLQQGKFNYTDEGMQKSFAFDKIAADFVEYEQP